MNLFITVIVVSIGAIALLFIIHYLYRIWRGSIIGRHVVIFEHLYNAWILLPMPQKDALQKALSVFAFCPRLNCLNKQELSRIVNILGDAPHPQKIISELILELDTTITIATFKNENLLKEVRDLAIRNENLL